MLIKWLRLQNIRSYESLEIDFSKGITLLAGDIGSGKSTILLSIEFALFGLIKGELTGSTLLRNGKAKGSVEICLDVDNKEIIIRRVLKKTNSSIAQDECYIIIDGVKKEASPIEVKSKVIDLLGYPEDMINKKNLLYRYTVYTPQEEMKRIIFEDKEERLNTLRKVFGIDKYKTIRENASLLTRKMKDECKEIEGYTADLEEKKQYAESIRRTINCLKDDVAPVIAQKKEQIEKIKAEEAEYENLKKSFEEHNKSKNMLARTDSELNEIIKQNNEDAALSKKLANEIKEALAEETKVDVTKREEIGLLIEELEQKSIAARDKRSSLREKDKNNEDNIKEAMIFIEKSNGKIKEKDMLLKKAEEGIKEISAKNRLSKRHDELSAELLELEKEDAGNAERLRSAREVVAKIKDIDDCPLCLQRVDHLHKREIILKNSVVISDLQGHADKDSKRKEVMQKEISEVKAKMALCERKEKELKAIEIALASIESICEQVKLKEKELDELISKRKIILDEKAEIEKMNIDDMTARCESLRKEKNRIDEYITRLRLCEEKKSTLNIISGRNIERRSRIAEINRIRIELKGALEKNKDIEKDMNSAESGINREKEKLKGIEITIAEKSALINAKDEELRKIDEETGKKNEAKGRLIRKKQYIAWLEGSFVNIIALIEKNILAQVYNEFNSLFQEWFEMLLEDEMVNAKLDDEFTPTIQQNGYDMDISNLSGGEKTALALAYRLSLNKVITDISDRIMTKDMIILDEPTDGFSEQQLDRMRDVLEKLCMGQVIIVSHESKIESFVDRVIRVRKEGHTSSIALS